MFSPPIFRRYARLDRIFSILLSGPLARRIHFNQNNKIPVLMYHSISNEEEKGVYPYYGINTKPHIFAEQMKYLSDSDCVVTGLDTALERIHSQNGCPDKFVVLTFDDGYLDFFTDAQDILRRFGFTATVYLPSSFIQDKMSVKFKGKDCLTWDKVRELSGAGHRFGSHSVTHRKLIDLKRKEIEEEIRQSKAVIESKIGKPVDSFSYPYAFPEEDREYKACLRGLLEEAGYRNGVSTNIGRISRTDDRYFLKRIPVNSFDDIDLFQAKIMGAYDWMFTVQKVYKHLRKRN
jgi:peptidoglycan/xylan/chitin deacetylase (PgdA/CDA1 family)